MDGGIQAARQLERERAFEGVTVDARRCSAGLLASGLARFASCADGVARPTLQPVCLSELSDRSSG